MRQSTHLFLRFSYSQFAGSLLMIHLMQIVVILYFLYLKISISLPLLISKSIWLKNSSFSANVLKFPQWVISFSSSIIFSPICFYMSLTLSIIYMNRLIISVLFHCIVYRRHDEQQGDSYRNENRFIIVVLLMKLLCVSHFDTEKQNMNYMTPEIMEEIKALPGNDVSPFQLCYR